jgi:N-acetylglucosaminyl-diphospho-decaprenol L-rhamnosyltransferase
MNYSDITVIITTFKSDKKIEKCINSINKKCKVLVIENSRNYSFKEAVEQKYPHVECIIPNDNLGYGGGNNVGLKLTKTRYSLILNPDAILENDSLEKFIIRIKENVDFAAIGPYDFQDKDIYKNLKDTKHDLINVESIKGFAMFLNMEKFKSIGFFDDNFFLYFEEIDLCRRIRNNFDKIYLDPTIKVFHEGAMSVDTSFSYQIELTRNWHWMWSTFYFHKKHKNYIFALFIISPKLFSALFKTMFYTLLFDVKKKSIYYHRLSGLLNSILGKKSWYRPSLD